MKNEVVGVKDCFIVYDSAWKPRDFDDDGTIYHNNENPDIS